MLIKSQDTRDLGRCSLANLEKLLHLVFPSRCIYCGRLSEERVHGFCHECYNSLSIYLRKIGFTWYVFEYDKKISRILKKAKYGGKPEAVKTISKLIGNLLADEGLSVDLVIPVPMYQKDLGERGYNQSGIAARRIAKSLGVSCKEKALKKTSKTRRQADLSRKARGQNLFGAFTADAGLVRDKRILIVDDIITTGSTLEECKGTLMAAGALSVEAAVIARTPLKKR